MLGAGPQPDRSPGPHASRAPRSLLGRVFTDPLELQPVDAVADDGAARAYGGYPDRLYLVGKDGKVVYRGGPGPRGFRPDELEREIKILLGILKARRMRV